MRERPCRSKIGIEAKRHLAMGKAFVHQDVLEQNLQAYEIRPNDVDTDCGRVHQAAEHVLNDLEQCARRVTQQIGP